ncbi:MAG TPA: SGNH/GDSL hydrolase family protein [Candidatus Limnocylindrales bacterium]
MTIDRRRLMGIAFTTVTLLAATAGFSVSSGAASDDARAIQAMGLTVFDDDCPPDVRSCGPGGGGPGGGGEVVGGCNPVRTQQAVSREDNPELGGAYSRIAFGSKWVCSSGVTFTSMRLHTEVWDRTPGQRVARLATAPDVHALNLESSAAADLYDVDYYPAAQRAEVVQLVEIDAGAGRYWMCQDNGTLSFLWCTGERTRYLSAVLGFFPFQTNLQNPKLNYVALGDSFASGSGAGNYEVGGGSNCLRSENSYPRVLVASNPGVFNLGRKRAWGSPGFRACHDATIDTVRGSQMVVNFQDTITRDVRLVTLSVGGNDLGYGPKLRNCIENDCSGGPLVTLDETLPVKTRLMQLYRDIRSKMATNGKLVVVTYPRIFPTGVFNPNDCILTAQKVKPAELTRINDAWNLVNLMIATAVSDVGDPNVVLLEVSDAFRGRDMCGPGEQWANGVMAKIDLIPEEVSPFNFKESFHPNDGGHAQEAFMLQQLLRQLGMLP